MSKYVPGQDVWVTFCGVRSRGEIVSLSKHSGYVMCRYMIDPVADYGGVTPRLAPVSVVCVHESDLEPLEPREEVRTDGREHD